MKNKWIIGVIVILIFGGFAFYSFSSSLSPYVTLDEAAKASGQVQVLGTIVEEKEISFDLETDRLEFYLVDEEGTVTAVSYSGPRPDNLEESENIVIVGQYINGIFHAEKLLVKCPSKYETVKEDNL